MVLPILHIMKLELKVIKYLAQTHEQLDMSTRELSPSGSRLHFAPLWFYRGPSMVLGTSNNSLLKDWIQ